MLASSPTSSPRSLPTIDTSKAPLMWLLPSTLVCNQEPHSLHSRHFHSGCFPRLNARICTRHQRRRVIATRCAPSPCSRCPIKGSIDIASFRTPHAPHTENPSPRRFLRVPVPPLSETKEELAVRSFLHVFAKSHRVAACSQSPPSQSLKPLGRSSCRRGDRLHLPHRPPCAAAATREFSPPPSIDLVSPSRVLACALILFAGGAL